MSYDAFTDGLPDDLRADAEAVSFDAYQTFGPGADAGTKNKAKPAARFKEIKRRLVRLDEVEPVLTCNYLIKGWLSAGGLSMLFGPSNVGKTFVALDMAMHVAAGRDYWRGCRVSAGAVLYVACEGGSGVLNRLAAFKAEHPHMASAPFTLLPVGVDLHGDGDAEIIATLLGDETPALIVVDTLARSMGDGDENTAKDAAMFVRNCDAIREATGAHVMVIHHSGKDAAKGARGSSALRAAVDTEIAVHGTSVSGRGRISCEKQRDMPPQSDRWFVLRSVTLGEDEDGDPVTSAVVDAADKPERESKALKGRDEVAMTALAEALREHGRKDMGDDYPADVTVVSLEDWRHKCAAHELTTGSSDSAARTAFKRAKDRLIELDLVRGFNDYFWRVSDD